MDLGVPLIHLYQFMFFTPIVFFAQWSMLFESSIKWELALGLEFQSEGSSFVYSRLSFLYIFFLLSFQLQYFIIDRIVLTSTFYSYNHIFKEI